MLMKGQQHLNMDKWIEKGDVLIEALPYIQRFNRKIIVVKYGGSAMLDEDFMTSVIQDITLLKLVGFKPIIVHGGGMETSFVNGLRVTDEETLDAAEMVLNSVNKKLVQIVEQLGVRAIGISGKDGKLLTVKKKLTGDSDIGYVGEVTEVNAQILLDLLEKDFLPIVCPIGLDNEFHGYNINADDAASAIAEAVNAEKLAFLTDTEGVYRNPEDTDSVISEMTVTEAQKLIEDGIIAGGMLPKIRNCMNAIKNGVSRVHILDGRIPHSILLEIFTNKGIGTAILDDSQEKFYTHVELKKREERNQEK